MHNVTILQQGVSPKVIENVSGSLGEVLSGQGINTSGFMVMRGGAPVALSTPITGDMTVTVTKRSEGA